MQSALILLCLGADALVTRQRLAMRGAARGVSMHAFDYDVAIIGCGVGGHGAALHARAMGLTVCVLSGGDVGGTCVNRGCVPSKALLAASGRVRELQDEAHLLSMGITLPAGATFEREGIAQHSKQLVAKVKGGLEGSLLKLGVTLLPEFGALTAMAHQIDLGGGRFMTAQVSSACARRKSMKKAAGTEPSTRVMGCWAGSAIGPWKWDPSDAFKRDLSMRDPSTGCRLGSTESRRQTSDADSTAAGRRRSDAAQRRPRRRSDAAPRRSPIRAVLNDPIRTSTVRDGPETCRTLRRAHATPRRGPRTVLKAPQTVPYYPYTVLESPETDPLVSCDKSTNPTGTLDGSPRPEDGPTVGPSVGPLCALAVLDGPSTALHGPETARGASWMVRPFGGPWMGTTHGLGLILWALVGPPPSPERLQVRPCGGSGRPCGACTVLQTPLRKLQMPSIDRRTSSSHPAPSPSSRRA